MSERTSRYVYAKPAMYTAAANAQEDSKVGRGPAGVCAANRRQEHRTRDAMTSRKSAHVANYTRRRSWTGGPPGGRTVALAIDAELVLRPFEHLAQQLCMLGRSRLGLA